MRNVVLLESVRENFIIHFQGTTKQIYIKSILHHVLTAFVLTVVWVICDLPPNNRELTVLVLQAYIKHP
jgi:hypothetical protein